MDVANIKLRRFQRSIDSSPNLMQCVLEHLQEPIFAVDMEQRFLYANSAFLTLHQCCLEDLIGDLSTTFSFASSQPASSLATQWLIEKLPAQSQFGDIEVYIMRDLSVTRDLEERLHEHEKRLDYALRLSGEGLWDWDLRTNRVRYNRYWQELTGNDVTEQGVEELLNLIHPEDREKIENAFTALIEREKPYEEVYRLVVAENKFIWIWDRGQIVERDESGKPLRIVGAMRDVSDSVNYQAKIELFAYLDQLTQLPNRLRLEQYLKEQLSLLQQQHQYLAVLFIDLDKFKQLNDTHGHHFGDRLLVELGKRLKGVVADKGLLARFGGDEFVAVIPLDTADEISALHRSELIAEDMHTAISADFELGYADTGFAITFQTSLSIGLVLTCDAESEINELLRMSDLALNKAKKNGRNCTATFDPLMQQELQNFVEMEIALKDALPRKQMLIVVQPKMNHRKECIGGEVLLRWNTKKGILTPPSFLQVAEETNLIHSLGHWVLQEACELLARWQQNPRLSGMSLSVNVSVQQLQSSYFMQQVISAVRNHKIDPTLLVLEITETTLMTNVELVIEQLQKLRNFGVRISIDDFGTGYSSLSYLKQLPVDELKVDQSFVRDMMLDTSDEMLIKTIFALGRNFALEIVAEGVETEEQFKRLRSFGCHIFQGYWFRKPLSIFEFEAYAASHSVKQFELLS